MTRDQATVMFLVGLGMLTGAFVWSLVDLVNDLHKSYLKWRRKRMSRPMPGDESRELEVFLASSGGGYEWAEFRVFTHPLRPDMYVTDWESGCSCNYYDYPSIEALGTYPPKTKTEVREELIKFLSANCHYFPAGTALDLVEKLHTTVA